MLTLRLLYHATAQLSDMNVHINMPLPSSSYAEIKVLTVHTRTAKNTEVYPTRRPPNNADVRLQQSQGAPRSTSIATKQKGRCSTNIGSRTGKGERRTVSAVLLS